jgi:hypothetical protein
MLSPDRDRVTAGQTLEEARRTAAEAWELHVKGMKEDGQSIPESTSLDAIMADSENRDAVAFLVGVPARPTRSIRINVMLPEDLVAAIDRVATNRSRFVADAAIATLKRRTVDG